MFAELLPWAPVIGLVLAGVIAGVFTIVTRRGGELSKRDPTWKELVDENRALRNELVELRTDTETRFDRIDRKFNATGRVLAALADQWQGEPPVLDAADIEELGTTLPLKFHPRRRTKKENNT